MFGLAFGNFPFGGFFDWEDEVPSIGFKSQTLEGDFISEAMTLEFAT